jgi:hypothetical protein
MHGRRLNHLTWAAYLPSFVRWEVIFQRTELLEEFVPRFRLPMLVVIVEGGEAAAPHPIDI